jgi:hypothetical protein
MHACRDFISNLHVPWFAFIDWESISLVFFRGVVAVTNCAMNS